MQLQNAPIPAEFTSLRRFEMDDAVLLFDRTTGLNVLCDGPEFVGLRQRCPRVVQFGITNRCNLTCHFCSRDTSMPSEWSMESALDLLHDLDRWGVLEVAFGGGEPLVFPEFVELVERLHAETLLAVNFTTNGLRLTTDLIARIKPVIGELRLSIYDDNDWRDRIRLLTDEGIRYGVNLLVTPDRLPQLEHLILELADLGCRDVLLLSYNGCDPSLHLGEDEVARLNESVSMLADALRHRVRLCLDVCWGSRLDPQPTLIERGDCGAGRDFLVITSNGHAMPCSFHDMTVPFETPDDLVEIWGRTSTTLPAAADPGCARRPDFGLSSLSDRGLPVVIGTSQ